MTRSIDRLIVRSAAFAFAAALTLATLAGVNTMAHAGAAPTIAQSADAPRG